MMTTTVALSLLVLAGIVLHPAHQQAGPAPGLASPGGFHMRARAGGLFPGATRPLRVRIRNPYRFAIKVNSIRVRIKRDPGRPRCYPRRHLRATRLRVPLRLGAKAVRRTRLKVKMKVRAPDACQRAVFPLRLKGRAVRP